MSPQATEDSWAFSWCLTFLDGDVQWGIKNRGFSLLEAFHVSIICSLLQAAKNPLQG